MNFTNITLKTAELGPVNWEEVEKLQPGTNGFICFISAETQTRLNMEGDEYNMLVGTYFDTPFNYKPSYKEIINYIISEEYPNGKEQEMLRLGIKDPQNEEYLAYFDKVEEICNQIKSILS